MGKSRAWGRILKQRAAMIWMRRAGHGGAGLVTRQGRHCKDLNTRALSLYIVFLYKFDFFHLDSFFS